MEKKVKIWLMGGLGNQLFQINKAYQLINEGVDVTLINNFVIRKKNWAQTILKWTIHPNITEEIFPHEIKQKRSNNLIVPILAKLKLGGQFSRYYGLNYNTDIANNMFGYFQDKISLHLPLDNFQNKDATKNKIVHLRFGDNNDLKYSHKYYLKAFSMLSDDKIIIVTDDKKSCISFMEKQNRYNYTIVSNNPIDDFWLLVSAQTLICAPSTFSFWAAIVGVKGQKVIAPMSFTRYVKTVPLNWELI